MRGRFEGWYYKHQANGKSLALIPGRAEDTAFVQVVTDACAYHVTYPLSAYRRGDVLRVGGNVFSSDRVKLDIQAPQLSLTGEIVYENLTPICGDIMGPFRWFPMECRHGVLSMRHTLHGGCVINGETQDFTGGQGYIESDSGRSFPKGYTWVQCNDFTDCSIMAAVARIPFYGLRFWGCICVVWLDGREYRLATYQGVKIAACRPGFLELKQGKHCLTITVDDPGGHALQAPRLGKMSSVIKENIACPAHFRFMEGQRVVFEGKSNLASYEYEIR
ncbi:MAG: tocopherol cyclase family protein [Oscillospiraceae bacterium]|nr:tocopherol cyclase family protein [Oscillospiraceae bacterium]